MICLFKSISPSSLNSLAIKAGYRPRKGGAHSSRTMMLEELRLLLSTVSGATDKSEYARAVLDDNCLGKRTLSTRKLSLQRLRELHGLDSEILYFKILRDL